MARLKRITNKIFGSTASTTGDPSTGAEIGQFGSAKLGTYNATANVEEIQALSAWDNGWIDAVIPSQQYPTLPEMTGVGKVLSYHTGYLYQEGVAEWDANTEYDINSIVKYASTTVTQTATGSIGDSTGISAVSVDSNTFLSQISYDGVYTFTFDGSDWYYNDILTNLALYGISVTGTAVADDEVIVTVTTTITINEQAKLYISLVSNNVNVIPTTDPTKWELYLDSSNFANKDLSNLSATGKTKVVTLAHELEWANKITVTTAPSNVLRTYICPDDGFVTVSAHGAGNTNATKAVGAQVYDNVAGITTNGGGWAVASAVNMASGAQYCCMYVQSQQTIGYYAYCAGFSTNLAEVYFIPFKKQ